jgi:hypothetical protein
MGTAVGVPLSTRETVDCETPVASAMSRIVVAPVRLAFGRIADWTLAALPTALAVSL